MESFSPDSIRFLQLNYQGDSVHSWTSPISIDNQNSSSFYMETSLQYDSTLFIAYRYNKVSDSIIFLKAQLYNNTFNIVQTKSLYAVHPSLYFGLFRHISDSTMCISTFGTDMVIDHDLNLINSHGIRDILAQTDSGFIFTDYTSFPNNGVGVSMIDFNGDTTWSTQIGPSDTYIDFGVRISGITYFSVQHWYYDTTYTYDFGIMSMDDNGIVLEDDTLVLPSRTAYFAYEILPSSDGKLLVGGDIVDQFGNYDDGYFLIKAGTDSVIVDLSLPKTESKGGISQYVHVFPIPADKEIIITNDSHETYQSTIYDLSGKRISSQSLTENKNAINTAGLKNGYYILEYNNNKQTGKVKFSIIH